MLIPIIPRRKNKKRVRKFLRQLFPDKNNQEIEELAGEYKKDLLKKNFFIRHQKKIVGLISISMIVLFRKRIFLFVHSMVVDKKSRKAGIGNKVIKKIKDFAIIKKASHIFLFSSPFRKKAHRFWQREGFKKYFSFLFFKKIDKEKH